MPEEERAPIHARLVHESGLVYRAMMFGSVRVDATKVKCPILVMGGREDRIVSEALLRSTAAHYDAPLRMYEGHAHWLLQEPGWEQICDDALHWLSNPAAVAAAE